MCGAFTYIYRVFMTDTLQYYTNKRGTLFFNIQPESIYGSDVFSFLSSSTEQQQ